MDIGKVKLRVNDSINSQRQQQRLIDAAKRVAMTVTDILQPRMLHKIEQDFFHG